MRKQIMEKYLNLSLVAKMRYSYLVIIVPVFLFVSLLFWNIQNYNRQYDNIVKSASSASEFSIDFKKDFDYKIYLIIVGNRDYDEADPVSDILEARRIVGELRDMTNARKNQIRLERIEKYLINLEKYTRQIKTNIYLGGRYDENIEVWDIDIKGVTSLIQESILEFIYYQTKEIDSLRIEMEQSYHNLMEISFLFLAMTICLTLILSVIIPKSITKPIRRLCSVTEEVSNGNLEIRTNIKNGIEMKKLGESLDIMIWRLKELIETVKMEQKHLREAELKLLQMQINPHFLYNTLDTIVWLAEGGNQKEVVKMVGSLSEFFRTSLSQGNDIITLHDEVTHVKSYLEIQQVRYQDILVFEILIPKHLDEYLIPKITLQPLIENALYHGIKNKRELGTIKVSTIELEDSFEVVVEDNGIGMTPERLDYVNEKIQKRNIKESDVYGLYNVNERIVLRFGEAYGLFIESKYKEGTKITIRLPYEKEAPKKFELMDKKNEPFDAKE
ncbi:MAG: two-component system, sensor histidine kinase YesM [Clostridiales bacterium]|nr:two-component system, sensor histidine kinase YesM [Clostridiales bacterium]